MLSMWEKCGRYALLVLCEHGRIRIYDAKRWKEQTDDFKKTKLHKWVGGSA